MSATADTPRHAPPPQDWLDALDRGRADLAAGRTHELADVLDDIEADISAMETEEQEQGPGPAPGR